MAQSIVSKGRPSLIAPRNLRPSNSPAVRIVAVLPPTNRRRPLLDEVLHAKAKIQALFYALVDFGMSRD